MHNKLSMNWILGAGLISLVPLFTTSSAQAVTLTDGKTSFVGIPQLTSAYASSNEVYSPSMYYFNLRVPENASESLQRVTIRQFQPLENVNFAINDSRAMDSSGTMVGKAATSSNSRDVSVVFDPPISPGKSVTIQLRPNNNPSVPGTYLYGVTATPTGEGTERFLGYGRVDLQDID